MQCVNCNKIKNSQCAMQNEMEKLVLVKLVLKMYCNVKFGVKIMKCGIRIAQCRFENSIARLCCKQCNVKFGVKMRNSNCAMQIRK